MKRRGGSTAAIGAVLLLAGCSAAPGPSTTPTVVITRTVTPSATSTAPATSGTPSTARPTSTPIRAGGSTTGCSNGMTTIPVGADVSSTVDVDLDGKPDQQFYAETDHGAEYGIRTGAGGVYTLADDLAGPGGHHGWTAVLDSAVGHVTVLDDGRTATLHAFVDCGFITTKNAEGKPYSFGLNGFSEYGTGVQCNDRNGGTLLEGAQAVERSDGRYDVRWTQIDVSADGRTATNGATETRWSGLAADDERVGFARESRCGDTPIVGIPNE